MRLVLLVLLTFDGVLSAVVGALFLPAYLGTVPMPVSAVVSGVLNAALVWAAAQWTSSRAVAAAPLWAFLATVIGLTLGGPGGDIVFAGTTSGLVRLLVLVAVGLIPAAWVMRRTLGGVVV
jgi:hypothetical protein